ncbi:MAG: AEC family transporter [Rhodoblastus sp.]|uniref:AEC family transporter n=1 Tax=Rhodoblastus sp. TaxID=1962975 RepID=UPI003F9728C0
METMILNALAPVFFVMAMGYYAGYRKMIDNQKVATLNLFVMHFALPSALFTAISRTPRQVILDNGQLMGILTFCMFVVYALTLFLQFKYFKVETGKAAVQTLTVALPNYASVGLPLLLSVYGPSSALSVAVAIAVGSVTVSPLTLVLLESAHATDKVSPAKLFLLAVLRTVKRPIVWAPLAGLVVALVGIPMPEFLNRCFTLIGQATAGAALFLTGLILSAQRLRINADVILGVFLKNVAQPLLAFGIVRALGIPDPIGGQTVLLIAIPAGFFGMVFGANHDVRSEEAGSTLVLSSLFSAITLAAFIVLLAPH